MAISYIGNDGYDEGDSLTAVSPTIHASAAEDDLMIAVMGRSGEVTATWDDDGGGGNGWTRLFSNFDSSGRDREIALFYKIHDGAEPTPTFTLGGSANKAAGIIHVFRGVDTSAPWDVNYVEGSHLLVTVNDETPPNPGITTVTDAAWVLLFSFVTHNIITAEGVPIGYTSRSETVANHRNLFVATKTISTSGAENPGSWTHANTGPGGSDSTNVIVAMRPAEVASSGHSVELELSPSVWTDVTADVFSKHPIRWTRGIPGSDPFDLVAKPGSMTFVLKNGAFNSAGLAGYYSPDHANVRSGFKHGVRVRLKLGTSPFRYVFNGKIKTIAPTPNTFGPQETVCVAFDWMDELATFDRLDLALLKNKNVSQGVDVVVQAVPTQPENTNYDAGSSTFPYLFDNIGGGGIAALSLMQDLMQSEWGHLFLRGDTTDGETLTLQARNSRVTLPSKETFVEGDIVGLEVPSQLDRIVNDIEVTTNPRAVDSDSNTVLAELEPLFVPTGESVTVDLDYTDPASRAENVGGDNVDIPDFTMWTSPLGGIDITSALGLSWSIFGSRISISPSNAGLVDGYLRGATAADNLQVIGRGIFIYAPEISRVENSASITTHGRRRLSAPMDMPYEGSAAVGSAVAELIGAIYGDITNTPTKVTLNTVVPSVFDRAIVLDIGDKITITETLAAVNEEVIIHGIEGEVLGGVVSISFILAPADTQDPFILDHATKGKLDNVTYKLGFG